MLLVLCLVEAVVCFDDVVVLLDAVTSVPLLFVSLFIIRKTYVFITKAYKEFS